MNFKTLNVLPLARFSKLTQWIFLGMITYLVYRVIDWMHLPAALLLGPMIAGILTMSFDSSIRLPKMTMSISQAIIGCMVGNSLTPEIVAMFLDQWFIFLGFGLMTLLLSILLGWSIGQLGILKGTTAIWGLLPGAASTMVSLAEDFGADPRLVAFMQYLRVFMVTIAAALVARFWGHVPFTLVHHVSWFEPLHWSAFAVTLTIVAVSLTAMLVPKFSGGIIILAIGIAAMVHLGGFSEIEIPYWLSALAFAMVGWSVGLRFTKEVLRAAAQALPQAVISILILILFCGGLAVILTSYLGIDPLSAYLATSPGGMDSVAIIAASTKVDLAFVLTLQLARFLVTLVIGPGLSKKIATISRKR